MMIDDNVFDVWDWSFAMFCFFVSHTAVLLCVSQWGGGEGNCKFLCNPAEQWLLVFTMAVAYGSTAHLISTDSMA